VKRQFESFQRDADGNIICAKCGKANGSLYNGACIDCADPRITGKPKKERAE